MPKQEILPPLSRLPAKAETPRADVVTARVPNIVPQYGAVGAYLATRRLDNTSRVADALTRLNNSETALVTSQTALVRANTALGDELCRAMEAPERRAHELELRRMARDNELSESRHSLLMHDMRRRTELGLAEAQFIEARTALTRARTAYVDAEQQLDSQIRHGALTYDLAHAEQNLKRLDIELSEEERRALLRKQLRDIEAAEDDAERAFRDRVSELFDTDDPKGRTNR
jgi:hypothetical protein